MFNMLTLVNNQIALKLGLNRSTITKYILEAKIFKNNLQVTKTKHGDRILDTAENWIELKRLAIDGKKYKKTTSHKFVNVDKKFEIFTEGEQYEIYNDLYQKKEIDIKYYYAGEGAHFWQETYSKGKSEISLETDKLIRDSLYDIDGFFIDSYNIIDLGCGTGNSAMQLFNEKILSYSAVDLSSEMLNIAMANISKEYNRLPIYRFKADFLKNTIENFYLKINRNNPNLVIFIGNTICNYIANERIQILNNCRMGLSSDDYFLISYSLKTELSKSYYKYLFDKNHEKAWLFKMLNFDVEECLNRTLYDETDFCKKQLFILDKDYTVKFKIGGVAKEIYFKKEDNIINLRHYVLDLPEIYNELKFAGFKPTFMKFSEKCVLIGCKVQ
jgi:uncharacterized SAM-dependent methyltransferase